jgi:hypothetical protein
MGKFVYAYTQHTDFFFFLRLLLPLSPYPNLSTSTLYVNSLATKGLRQGQA